MKNVSRAAASAAAVLLASVAMAQPSNDECHLSNPAFVGDNPFTNVGATTDADPDCVFSGSDVWYIFTPPATGTYVIDLCGADFDTTLTVYLDCGAFPQECNDDFCDLGSQVTVSAFEGLSFFIRVAGFGGDQGSGVMHINSNGGGTAQWDEFVNGGSDAGDSIATAQVPVGSGQLLDIGGILETGDTVDMYKITICDPANFSATTTVPATGFEDTQLFLFDASGNGVEMNDDDPFGMGELTSRLDNSFVTTAGDYYIAVSHYDIDPSNSIPESIWADTPFNVVRAPDGALNGGDITLASWDDTVASTFAYGIEFTGVCFPGGGGCAADFNGDTVVDFFDYLDFVDAFSAQDPTADFNGDTVIDFFDYLDFVDAFSAGC